MQDYFDRFSLRFVPFLGFEGCAPCRGISAVGFTFKRRESASFSGSGMRMLFPGFPMRQ